MPGRRGGRTAVIFYGGFGATQLISFKSIPTPAPHLAGAVNPSRRSDQCIACCRSAIARRMLRGRMFPNVRLLVGALFASVVALTCGFGLFAAFRVNHEPLSRLPVGTAPIALVANEVAAPRTGWGTPFDGQSRLNGPQHSEIVADAPAVAPAGQASVEAASLSAAETVKPVAAATPVVEMAPRRALAQPAEIIEPVVSITPASNAVSPPGVVPEQIARAPSPADSRSPSANTNAPPEPDPAQPTGTIASTPATPEQSARAAPEPSESLPPVASAAPAVSAAPVAAEPSSQKPTEVVVAATPAPAAKQGSDSGAAVKSAAPAIASATPLDQPPAIAPPVNDAGPSPRTVAAPAKAAAKPARKIEAKDSKVVRKTAVYRRVAVRKRIVRRVRRRTGQDGFSDPVFQSAPNFSGASASRSAASSSNW